MNSLPTQPKDVLENLFLGHYDSNLENELYWNFNAAPQDYVIESWLARLD